MSHVILHTLIKIPVFAVLWFGGLLTIAGFRYVIEEEEDHFYVTITALVYLWIVYEAFFDLHTFSYYSIHNTILIRIFIILFSLAMSLWYSAQDDKITLITIISISLYSISCFLIFLF